MFRFKMMLFSLMVAVSAVAAKVEKTVTLKVGNSTRSYLLYVPNNVKNNTPLVFSLHGTSGHSSDKSPFRTAVADSKGCIVVYPQGSDIYFPVFGGTLPGWHSEGVWSEDIDFFKAIIEDVASKYSIDRKRIYCCGFSNGGMMTYTVANVASDIFAAFCSISGMPLNEFHLHHTSARPIPFLHIHGKADDFVKYSLMPSVVDDMVARNGCNPVAEKKTVSGKYTKSVFSPIEGGMPYIYYEVDGMGHSDYTDRTDDNNSALTMWNFMSKYTVDSPCDTTMKWRPIIEAEGWAPKSHGWTVNSGTTLLMFGKDQKTDANQNVYRSLQFENGKYKLKFKADGDADKVLRVNLQSLAKKTYVFKDTVSASGETTIFFDIDKGWGEYKLTIYRPSSADVINITELGIYTATAEEEQEYITTGVLAPKNTSFNAPEATWQLNGMLAGNSQSRGIQIVRHSDGTVKKIVK